MSDINRRLFHAAAAQLMREVTCPVHAHIPMSTPFQTICMRVLVWQARELFVPAQCPVLVAPPDPLTFYREFVARNVPCIIQNALVPFVWMLLH